MRINGGNCLIQTQDVITITMLLHRKLCGINQKMEISSPSLNYRFVPFFPFSLYVQNRDYSTPCVTIMQRNYYSVPQTNQEYLDKFCQSSKSFRN